MTSTNRKDGISDQERFKDRQIKKLTWAGLIMNIGLSALKFACGLLGNSQALVADAVHSLSDIITDLAILLGIRYWSRPADASHPHGHRQVETVVTLTIGFILAFVAFGLLWNAIETLREQDDASPGWIALVAAFISIVSKELLYRWTVATGIRIRSMPLIANAWHHRSDAFSSIPVLVAVAGAAIDPSWAFLDHIGALIV
ncbi:MAG: cation diffusion facilitator family transporter, partial [Planctomycetota bacterium]